MNDIAYVQCPTRGCGHSPFPVSADFDKRAQRTHESFHCPAGHSMSYQGKSEEEELRDEVNRLKRRLENYMEFYDRTSKEARTCPWPTCREYVYSSRTGLYDHMVRIHGMPRLAEVREAS